MLVKTPQQYKTIFLDWDGTLCNSRFWGQWGEGQEGELYTLIQKGFFSEQQDFLARWMRGSESVESACGLLSNITGRPYEYLFKNLEESCKTMTFVSDEIPTLIKKLRTKSYQVVIATNNMDTFTRWTVPSMNLRSLFNDILDSYSLKALKKDVLPDGKGAFFIDYLQQHHIKNGESLLIDDNLFSQKVEEFGIDFVHVNESQPILQILELFSKK